MKLEEHEDVSASSLCWLYSSLTNNLQPIGTVKKSRGILSISMSRYDMARHDIIYDKVHLTEVADEKSM